MMHNHSLSTINFYYSLFIQTFNHLLYFRRSCSRSYLFCVVVRETREAFIHISEFWISLNLYHVNSLLASRFLSSFFSMRRILQLKFFWIYWGLAFFFCSSYFIFGVSTSLRWQCSVKTKIFFISAICANLFYYTFTYTHTPNIGTERSRTLLLFVFFFAKAI